MENNVTPLKPLKVAEHSITEIVPTVQAHLMLDTETMGTVMGSTILSIGGVAFEVAMHRPRILGTFYRVVSTESCMRVGLRIDPATEEWWERQDDAAREVLRACDRDDFEHALPVVLHELRVWCNFFTVPAPDRASTPTPPLIWGNGAAFDNPMLQTAAHHCGLTALWGHRQDRCYRTLKALFPSVETIADPDRIEHHALSDAMHQARHLNTIFNYNNWR